MRRQTVAAVAICLALASCAGRQKLPRTVNAFLEQCKGSGISTVAGMRQALGIERFLERYGDSEDAIREHADEFHPIVGLCLEQRTLGVCRYAETTHLDRPSPYRAEAELLLLALGYKHDMPGGGSGR